MEEQHTFNITHDRDFLQHFLTNWRTKSISPEMVEKLKENSFEEFKREVNSAESKEVDELVSYTYGERIKKNNHTETESE